MSSCTNHTVTTAATILSLLIVWFSQNVHQILFYLFLDDTTNSTEVEVAEGFDQDVGEEDELGTTANQPHSVNDFYNVFDN